MRPAAKVAMSGICTALSVLLLFFGGVVPVLAYVCPMLTGVLMVVLVSGPSPINGMTVASLVTVTAVVST